MSAQKKNRHERESNLTHTRNPEHSIINPLSYSSVLTNTETLLYMVRGAPPQILHVPLGIACGFGLESKIQDVA